MHATQRTLFFLFVFRNTKSEKTPLQKTPFCPNLPQLRVLLLVCAALAFSIPAHAQSSNPTQTAAQSQPPVQPAPLYPPGNEFGIWGGYFSRTPKSSDPHPTASSAFSRCVTRARYTTSHPPRCSTRWTSCRSKRCASLSTHAAHRPRSHNLLHQRPRNGVWRRRQPHRTEIEFPPRASPRAIHCFDGGICRIRQAGASGHPRRHPI